MIVPTCVGLEVFSVTIVGELLEAAVRPGALILPEKKKKDNKRASDIGIMI